MTTSAFASYEPRRGQDASGTAVRSTARPFSRQALQEPYRQHPGRYETTSSRQPHSPIRHILVAYDDGVQAVAPRVSCGPTIATRTPTFAAVLNQSSRPLGELIHSGPGLTGKPTASDSGDQPRRVRRRAWHPVHDVQLPGTAQPAGLTPSRPMWRRRTMSSLRASHRGRRCKYSRARPESRSTDRIRGPH